MRRFQDDKLPVSTSVDVAFTQGNTVVASLLTGTFLGFTSLSTGASLRVICFKSMYHMNNYILQQRTRNLNILRGILDEN